MLAKLAPSLAPIALLLLAGGALLALSPRPIEHSRLARWGYAYLLGVAWVSLGAWASGLVLGARVGVGLFAVWIAGAVVAGAAAIALRHGDLGGLGGAPRSASRAGRWWLLPGASVMVLATVALLAGTTADPVTDFDGRMTWGTQARYVDAAGSVLPPVLRDAAAYVIHPRYPLLLPLAQVFMVRLSGSKFDGYSVRPLYVLFLPALAAILVPALVRIAGARAAGLALALVLCSPFVLWDPQGGAGGTYSDLPLAAFLGAGFLVLVHPATRFEPWRGVAAGLLLAAAVGAKNEGMVLAPMTLVAAWGLGTRRSHARLMKTAHARTAVVVALALALVVTWRSAIPNRNDEGYLETFSLTQVAAGLVAKGPRTAAAIARLSLDLETWGLLFWVAPALVVAGWRGRRRRAVRVALGLLAAQCLLAIAAFAIVEDFGIVGVTWNRFLLQAIVPLAVVVAAACSGTLAALRRVTSGRA